MTDTEKKNKEGEYTQMDADNIGKEEPDTGPVEQPIQKKEAAVISIEDVMRLDLRIAEVISAEEHPNADKLLVLKIKVADEERQLVAGIKKAYETQSLVGKKIVIIANLKPAVLRGIESQGMLLAASDGDDIAVLSPDKDIPSGSKVK